MSRMQIGPVPLDPFVLHTFLETVRDRIARRIPSQIVTLNALMFNMAIRNPSLAGIISSAAIVVPDSSGISWAARLLRRERVTRLAGIDLIQHLCDYAAKNGLRVFFLGSRPGTAETAASKLQARHPGLIVAGTHHGYFVRDDEDAILREIRGAQPDILFVGLAIPRQEIWIAEHLAALGIPAVMGVGGSFDVISGNLKRAPLWMRRWGIEWLFRLIQQPWRIRRILDLPSFVLYILWLKVGHR